MDTPICDFVKAYSKSDPVRAHMPGHKGHGVLGIEKYDITEIDGADELFCANGIIAQSEANASRLFGCNTFYSTEGSSLCIRAMLCLAMAASKNERPLIIASRNAHKTFIHSAAMLDFDVSWLCGTGNTSYHSCNVTPEEVESAIRIRKPCAVYITSPDYLGNIADIAGISTVCKKHGVLLLVDCAHGAYLKFLPESLHPIDLGADMCCTSAHKTLPALTGGAYLHIKDNGIASRTKNAMSLFASTSPSYLILQSLDALNTYLEDFPPRLKKIVAECEKMKRRLKEHGYALCGDEPLKITLAPKPFGYSGDETAAILKSENIYCEFHDPDFVVLMMNENVDIQRISDALLKMRKREPIKESFPRFERPERVLSPREAVFAGYEVLPTEKCEGRILAAANISCPPAVPIVMCGERISANAISAMKYYGIENCAVVK